MQMPVDPKYPEMRRRRFRPIPVRMLVPNVITLLAICAGLTAIRLSYEGRLEFAVIGNTVNVASRLESLTREFQCSLVASNDLVQRARAETSRSNIALMHLVERPAWIVRGLEQPVDLWIGVKAP